MCFFQFLRKSLFGLEKYFFLLKKCIYFISYCNENPIVSRPIISNNVIRISSNRDKGRGGGNQVEIPLNPYKL